MTLANGSAALKPNKLWVAWEGWQPVLLSGMGLSMALLMPAQSACWLGGWLRHGLDIWLVLILLTVFWVGLRWEATLLRGALAAVLSFLYGLILTGLWSNVYSEFQVASGGIFFSDAHQYYADSLRLLNGFRMSYFSTRHPLATLFQFGVLTLLGGNLQLCLAGMAYLLSVSQYWSAKAVEKQDGAVAAAIYLWMLFLFGRRFVGYPNSEIPGILLGALAAVWLWRGASESNLRLLWFGFFYLILALLTRPGPLGMIPFILTALIPLRKGEIGSALRRLAPGICLMAAVLVLNLGLIRVLAEEHSGLFSNYGEIFYGLAHGGKGWEQFSKDHPEYQRQPETQRQALAFQFALKQLIADPTLMLRGVVLSYGDFFSLRDESAFGFLAGGEVASLNLPPKQSQRLFWGCLRLAMSILSLVGLLTLWRNRAQPDARLWLFALLGLAASVALLPPKDAGMMRLYAAALPFLARLPALGISWARKGFDQNQPALDRGNNPVIFSGLVVGILAFSLISPFVIKRVEMPADWQACAAGADPIVFRVYPGSYVNLLESSEIAFSRLPNVNIADFRSSLSTFHRQDVARGLLGISAGHIVLSTINLQDGQALWVILPTEHLPRRATGQLLSACGRWDAQLLQSGFGFFRVETAEPLNR